MICALGNAHPTFHQQRLLQFALYLCWGLPVCSLGQAWNLLLCVPFVPVALLQTQGAERILVELDPSSRRVFVLITLLR